MSPKTTAQVLLAYGLALGTLSLTSCGSSESKTALEGGTTQGSADGSARDVPTIDVASSPDVVTPSADAGIASGGSSGSGGGSGGSSGSSSGTSEPYTGSVILADEVFGSSTLHSSVVELLATSSASSPSCSGGTVSGSCCFEPPLATSSSGGIPTAYSAGIIAVADGSTTLGTIPFSNGAYTALISATSPSFTWSPGDSLTVSAPGATIDSFSATVKAPGVIAGLTPSFTAPTIT